MANGIRETLGKSTIDTCSVRQVYLLAEQYDLGQEQFATTMLLWPTTEQKVICVQHAAKMSVFKFDNLNKFAKVTWQHVAAAMECSSKVGKAIDDLAVSTLGYPVLAKWQCHLLQSLVVNDNTENKLHSASKHWEMYSTNSPEMNWSHDKWHSNKHMHVAAVAGSYSTDLPDYST